jgi:hypothetical protein
MKVVHARLSRSTVVLGASLIFIGCFPPQMARVSQVEAYSQRFLPMESTDQLKSVWKALAGVDNVNALEATQSKEKPKSEAATVESATTYRGILGKVTVRGRLIVNLSTSRESCSKDVALLEGIGDYVVATDDGRERDAGDSEEAHLAVAEAEFSIGRSLEVTDRKTGLLFSVPSFMKRCARKRGEDCFLDLPIKQRVWLSRPVVEPGKQSRSYAHASTFSVRVHFTPISSSAFTVNYDALHEMTIDLGDGKELVFGCLRFDDPAPFEKRIEAGALWMVDRACSWGSPCRIAPLPERQPRALIGACKANDQNYEPLPY